MSAACIHHYVLGQPVSITRGSVSHGVCRDCGHERDWQTVEYYGRFGVVRTSGWSAEVPGLSERVLVVSP